LSTCSRPEPNLPHGETLKISRSPVFLNFAP
jgi:hypothetical protein